MDKTMTQVSVWLGLIVFLVVRAVGAGMLLRFEYHFQAAMDQMDSEEPERQTPSRVVSLPLLSGGISGGVAPRGSSLSSYFSSRRSKHVS